MGADLFALAALKFEEFVFGRKSYKTIAKNVGKQTESGRIAAAELCLLAESLQQSLEIKSVGREQTFLQVFPANHVN